MPLTFTFALSQNQTFELRCDYGTRRLDTNQLDSLINLCEEKYYSQQKDDTAQLRDIGCQLYSWLDGKEGWLRQALNAENHSTIYLDLIQTSEAQGLNPQTQNVALGLAHLPWELLHNGTVFLHKLLPVRAVKQQNNPVIPQQNRPLRLLFMATSPEHPGIAPLQFEQEEANILKATQEQPLALIVEESGSVAELANLVQSYSADYFDVFHLTGHGVIYTVRQFGSYLPPGVKIQDYTPCFITEDEVGGVQFTTVDDLAKAFRGRFPRVVFLSGCHTGQLANNGTVPSMAQALVKAGVGVVLGWARPVFDRTGIIAAQALYQALATGATVEDAVKTAQQEMITQECSDWHLLRIYRDTRQIQELVTPLLTRKREKLKFTPPESEFLDENNIVKVASRGEFVGRRKALQRGMLALRVTSDNIGVFLAGMGGLGKSSLAARLCTRVQSQRPNFQRVVLIGPVSEVGLINKLASKYERFAGVPALLNQPGISFKGRLQNFFEAIEETHDQPLLLVLDDFEQNIPQGNIADGSLRMTAEAYEVLAALCAALAENQAESRLIVTCRYLKEDTLPPHRLHLESLQGMGEADINKIYWQLDQDVRLQVKKQRLLRVADGNPRLLKWLVEIVQLPDLATEELLKKLEGVQLKFREDILAEVLLNALEDEEKKFLARLSVFRLPVTEEIIKNLSPTPLLRGEGLKTQTSTSLVGVRGLGFLPKLISLSLVESATTFAQQIAEYRVTTILEPLLQPILTEEEWQTTRQAATRRIYQTWWEETDKHCTEVQALEIIRLGVLVKEQEITVSVCSGICNYWLNVSRFLETLALCHQILNFFQDYRLLVRIARAEKVLGLVEDAIDHYQSALTACPDSEQTEKAWLLISIAELIVERGEMQQALLLLQQSLDICEHLGNLSGKAASLHYIAGIFASQGHIEPALQMWQESLEIKESIGDIQGKAATLSNMAGVFAQKGDIEQALQMWQQDLEISRLIHDVQGQTATLNNMAYILSQKGDTESALQLWEQSLELDEFIGNIQGKATTLANMAVIASKAGDKVKGIELNLQALRLLVNIRAYRDLIKVLWNLGATIDNNCLAYLSQALWLTFKINHPLVDSIDLIDYFYQSLPSGNELQALLAINIVFLCKRQEKDHPDLSVFQNVADRVIYMLALSKGIETPTDMAAWFTQQGLSNPEYFIPRLMQSLEELIDDKWLFDHSEL
ncbi:tetratricopeptide repeat protein [Nodularia chucula]|uniref:tetratricopeptide repeat protein n=1 Tax=Nodularia chucula TaxID=3093667 RepID=UPI0039C6A264